MNIQDYQKWIFETCKKDLESGHERLIGLAIDTIKDADKLSDESLRTQTSNLWFIEERYQGAADWAKRSRAPLMPSIFGFKEVPSKAWLKYQKDLLTRCEEVVNITREAYETLYHANKEEIDKQKGSSLVSSEGYVFPFPSKRLEAEQILAQRLPKEAK